MDTHRRVTIGEQACTVDLENLTVQFDQKKDKQIPLKIFQLVAPADLPETCRSCIARALENNFFVNARFLWRHVKACPKLSGYPDPKIMQLSLNSGPTGSSGEQPTRKRKITDPERSAFR